MKINDVILRTVTKAVVFIILTLGVYLFFAGHHAPGGGFIGGLVLASGIVLLYLAYDIETVHKGMPFDFKKVAALGVLLATGTAVGTSKNNEPTAVPVASNTPSAATFLKSNGIPLCTVSMSYAK